MSPPTAEELTVRLQEFVEKNQVTVNPNFANELRRSGVFAVLDCVFSSMAHFERVVKPTLRRFEKNSGLVDQESLTFGEFLNYVRGGNEGYPSEDRFEEVASKIFENRQKISGRTKVEVSYDVCDFFDKRGYQTKQDLMDLPKGIDFTCDHIGQPGQLEQMVMGTLVSGQPQEGKVRGIGLALGAYLLMCFGDRNYVKPDTLLLRLMGRIGDWKPRASHEGDFLLIRQAVTCVAHKRGTTAAELDNALWAYEGRRVKASLTP
jgi:hypothetical protein